MSTTNAARLRQRTQRLEIPDKPISTSAVQSVEAACHKFLQKGGMIYKLTSSYSGKRVKKEANGNQTTEVAGRSAESSTLPTQSDSNGQAASMTFR
jgi:hypothetical protein